jgi:hypothetical protein
MVKAVELRANNNLRLTLLQVMTTFCQFLWIGFMAGSHDFINDTTMFWFKFNLQLHEKKTKKIYNFFVQ